MSAFQLVPALFCAAIAIYCIVYVVRSVVSPFFGSLSASAGSSSSGLFRRGFVNRMRLKRKQRLLDTIDQHIDSEEIEQALRLLPEVFFLRTVLGDPEIIGRIGSVHISALNKALILAEVKEVQLSNLPVVEDLLSSRVKLLKAYLESSNQKRQAKSSKRSQVPDWAEKEYSKKIQEARDALETNRRSIMSELRKLFEQLHNPSQSEENEITYH